MAAEICEDVWVPCPPSIRHALARATVIVNCSASDEVVGKDSYRRELICGSPRDSSAVMLCQRRRGRIHSGSGIWRPQYHCGEWNPPGGIRPVRPGDGYGRSGSGTANAGAAVPPHTRQQTGAVIQTIRFSLASSEKEQQETGKLLPISTTVPSFRITSRSEAAAVRKFFTIQAMGLKKRLEHTGCSHVVLGISGGLDSTLALLVAASL